MTKKTEIVLQVFLSDSESWTQGKTNTFLNTEEEKTIINVKIKKVGSYASSELKWERSYKMFAIYTIEPLEFTFLDKIENIEEGTEIPLSEGKKVKVDYLAIVYKDLKNDVPNLDEIFKEGAEIKLRLKNNPNIEKEKFEYWLLRDNSDKGKETYGLEIYSDYEIITPNGTIAFPKLTWEERENRELKEKWDREKAEEEKKEIKTEQKKLSAQEYLNNLYQLPEQVKSINLSSQKLEGELDFSNFPNLELLNLEDNNLTSLNVSKCPKLKILDARGNNDLTLLSVEKLSNFERIITDAGKLSKNSFLGGPSEWEPTNVDNPNIAQLKIIETKKGDNSKFPEQTEETNQKNENKWPWGKIFFYGGLGIVVILLLVFWKWIKNWIIWTP